jgi:hypothetical protein
MSAIKFSNFRSFYSYLGKEIMTSEKRLLEERLKLKKEKEDFMRKKQ